jgi:glycolate oxidase iron-sulfur subunit
MSLLRAAQRLRVDRLAAALLPKSWREIYALAPVVPPASERMQLPPFTPALGEKRGRVALFVGCVMPELFGAVNAATVRVLSRNGFEVVVPESQGCCGALHAHTGDRDFARDLARRNLEAFAAVDFDAVIVNSAGCGAVLRELEEWFPGEGASLGRRVRDVSEFLDAVGLRPPEGRIESRVCYDDPCHLVHGQRVDAAPRRLLEQIPGLQLQAHDDPTGCCGAAGIYNLTHRVMSRAILDRKMQSLGAADPDYVATGNPGCLMQLRAGVAAAGLRAAVVHPIELLDQAYAHPAVKPPKEQCDAV